MDLALVVSLIGLAFLLVNCILYNRTGKGKDVLYTILRVYLTLLFIIEVFCHIVGVMKPNSNFFLSHYYFIFQFVCLSLFFYNLFTNKKLKVFVLTMLVVVLLFLGCQYYTTPGLYWVFNIYEIAITTLLLILYASFFLAQFHKQYFYFCFGLIAYLSCSSYIFMSGNVNFVMLKEPIIVDIWVFNYLFYIFYQYMIYKEWKLLTSESSD